MTSEQIENLKGRLDERCVDGEGINVTREDVEKLLDERKALLEALTPIVERLDGDREFVVPDGGAEMLVVARAAIVKAES